MKSTLFLMTLVLGVAALGRAQTRPAHSHGTPTYFSMALGSLLAGNLVCIQGDSATQWAGAAYGGTVTRITGAVTINTGTLEVRAAAADVHPDTGEIDVRGNVHMSTRARGICNQ